MRAVEFEASLSEAKQYPQIWRLGLGMGLVVLLWLGTAFVIFAVSGAYVSAQRGSLPAMTWLFSLQNPVLADQVLILLATFIGVFLGTLVAAAALHFRGPGSLFGPWDAWRRGFAITLAVMAPIYGGVMAVRFFLDAPAPNLSPNLWLMFLPLTVVLVFVQAGAQELFFRGYLQQQLAARFQARWIWMWIPAAIFAATFAVPGAGDNWPLVLLAGLTFGLICADLTERTGSLGPAMGFHFGSSLIGMALVSSTETMSGLALFARDIDIGVTGPASLDLTIDIFVMLITWGITVRMLDR